MSNFVISVLPASLSIQQGNQGTSTITTTISGGFNGAITLSASGMPSGTTVSFNPNPIPAPGGGNSTLTITVGAATAVGSYPITVTGNGGGMQQNTTLMVTVTAASAWQQGFDFRNSASFVTDPPGDTYVLSSTAYPTTVGGATFGWVKTSSVTGRDRNATLDPRLAGINYANNGKPATFYVDLPSAGTYNLSLAMGDAGYQQCWVQCQIQFLDGSTVLATVTEGSISRGYFYDVEGNKWSAGHWPTSNLSQQVTLAGTRLIVVVGTSKSTGDSTPIAFLGVAQVSSSPNFAISASPASLSVAQGNQGTSTITTTISGGFNGAITLSASGVPSGTTVSFNPNPIAAPGAGSSTMTLTVGASTPVGSYPITVSGNGGGVQQNTTVTLTVTAQQQPNFTISASPASLSIQQGNQGTSTLTTTISGGFNSAITFSTSGAPSGTTVSFNTNPIPAPGTGNSTMTVVVGSTTPVGSYPLTVMGNGGGLQQNTTVTLTVTPGSGSAEQVTNLQANFQNGQTFISWNDPYAGSGSGTSNAANYRYNIYRSITNCPITSTSQGTLIQNAILNDYAVWQGAQVNPLTLAMRTNGTNQQDTLFGSTLSNPSGATAHTATASESACYAVVTHDTTGTLSDSDPVSIFSYVTESIATIQPILQRSCANNGNSNCPTGSNKPLFVKLHGSGSYAPTQPGYGDLWNLFGDSTMGYQEGTQTVMSVNQQSVTFGISTIIASPQDLVWRDDGLTGGGGGSLETYWFGYTCDERIGVGCSGRYAQPYSINKLNALLSFLTSNYSVNTNQIYGYGVSMGGHGMGIWALRKPNTFAFLYGSSPVWYWHGVLPSMINHVAGYDLTTTLPPGAPWNGQKYVDFENTPSWYASQSCNYLMPVIAQSSGRNDTRTSDSGGNHAMWDDAMAMLNAAVGCHYGFMFAWNNGTHGQGPEPIATFSSIQGLYKLNQSYPAFTSFSLDNNPCASGSPGAACTVDYTSGDCSSGSPGSTCTINKGWSWSIVADASNTWIANISNSTISSTATAAVTVRNAQNFVVSPGQPVNWTATGGQGGSVQADSYGLVTIPSITFTSSAAMVTLTLQQ